MTELLTSKESIKQPTLIVDKSLCQENISFMFSKAKRLGIKIRPHFKTHQSIDVGRWFREYDVHCIAVSSVGMAEYFANDGWEDITIAFPFVTAQSNVINKLATKINLQLVVSSAENANNATQYIKNKLGVFIEIDTGQGRSGVDPNDNETIRRIIESISSNQNISFLGFLTHAGHSYQKNSAQLSDFNHNICKSLSSLKNEWIKVFPNLIVTYGDTPTNVVCDRFEGVDELRPGNFIFFDMQQASQEVCHTNNIAIWLAAPIVSVYPEQLKAIVWSGAVHLSKDFYVDNDGNKSYGAVCNLNNDLSRTKPIEGLFVESLSQEHGVIRARNAEALNQIVQSNTIAILPAHSCLTVHAMREFVVKGEGVYRTL